MCRAGRNDGLPRQPVVTGPSRRDTAVLPLVTGALNPQLSPAGPAGRDPVSASLLLDESHRVGALHPAPDFSRHRPGGHQPGGGSSKDTVMGKGDSKRGNKETKKPKKDKAKVSATANFNAGKETKIGGKTVK